MAWENGLWEALHVDQIVYTQINPAAFASWVLRL